MQEQEKMSRILPDMSVIDTPLTAIRSWRKCAKERHR
jgi:hypothetical protein